GAATARANRPRAGRLKPRKQIRKPLFTPNASVPVVTFSGSRTFMCPLPTFFSRRSRRITVCTSCAGRIQNPAAVLPSAQGSGETRPLTVGRLPVRTCESRQGFGLRERGGPPGQRPV